VRPETTDRYIRATDYVAWVGSKMLDVADHVDAGDPVPSSLFTEIHTLVDECRAEFADDSAGGAE
jgi:hypothetical protein